MSPQIPITNGIDATHFFLNPELATKTIKCQGHEVPVHYFVFFRFTGLTAFLGGPDNKMPKQLKTMDYNTFHDLLQFLYTGSFYEIGGGTPVMSYSAVVIYPLGSAKISTPGPQQLINLSKLWNIAEYFKVHDLSKIVAAKFATICKECSWDLEGVYSVVDEVYGAGYTTFTTNFPGADIDDNVDDKSSGSDNKSKMSKPGPGDDTEDLEPSHDQAEEFLAKETGIVYGIDRNQPKLLYPSLHEPPSSDVDDSEHTAPNKEPFNAPLRKHLLNLTAHHMSLLFDDKLAQKKFTQQGAFLMDQLLHLLQLLYILDLGAEEAEPEGENKGKNKRSWVASGMEGVSGAVEGLRKKFRVSCDRSDRAKEVSYATAQCGKGPPRKVRIV